MVIPSPENIPTLVFSSYFDMAFALRVYLDFSADIEVLKLHY